MLPPRFATENAMVDCGGRMLSRVPVACRWRKLNEHVRAVYVSLAQKTSSF